MREETSVSSFFVPRELIPVICRRGRLACASQADHLAVQTPLKLYFKT